MITREHYNNFLESLSDLLNREHPDVCFYIYGSALNGDRNYGRSDIDGGLILPARTITPKTKLIQISKLLERSLANCPSLKIQFNLMDLNVCRDGRFLSYTTDFTDWIKTKAKVLAGPDILGEMNGLNYKSGVLGSAAHNFCGPGSVRNTLLYFFTQDEDTPLSKRVKKAIEKSAKFPNKLR